MLSPPYLDQPLYGSPHVNEEAWISFDVVRRSPLRSFVHCTT